MQEHYAEIRRTLRGVKLHIDETVRAELGDDFTRTRQEAFRNGIILTTKDGEGVGCTIRWNGSSASTARKTASRPRK